MWWYVLVSYSEFKVTWRHETYCTRYLLCFLNISPFWWCAEPRAVLQAPPFALWTTHNAPGPVSRPCHRVWRALPSWSRLEQRALHTLASNVEWLTRDFSWHYLWNIDGRGQVVTVWDTSATVGGWASYLPLFKYIELIKVQLSACPFWQVSSRSFLATSWFFSHRKGDVIDAMMEQVKNISQTSSNQGNNS